MAALWNAQPTKRRPEIAFAIKLTVIVGLVGVAVTTVAVQKVGKLDIRMPAISSR